MSEANSILRSVLTRSGTVTDKEIRDAYERTEKVRQRLYGELQKDIAAAQRLGISADEVYKILRESRVTKKLLREAYTPYMPRSHDQKKRLRKALSGETAPGFKKK